MQRHASALKAARQAVKRRDRNRRTLSTVRTAMKDLRAAVATPKKGSKEELTKKLDQGQRLLMKAASKNIMKRGTANRYVSRLSSAIHRATA